METHDSFLRKAEEVTRRLEAEGMHLTAEALKMVMGSYARDQKKEKPTLREPNISKEYSWLTRH